jgi:GNAT superfamily N-acetyltransferase
VSHAFTVVPGSLERYPDFVRLFPELEVPDRTPPLEYFIAHIVEESFFVLDGPEVVGYAWVRVRGDALHLVHVIVAPSHRRHGVGRALMAAAAERARALGLTRWFLNVKPDNVAARALYEACGLTGQSPGASVRITWADVERLPVSTHTLDTRPLEPEEDGAFEEALGFGRSELAAFRVLGRIVIGTEDLDDGRRPVGVAALDAPFPGASPFRVRAPEFARHLLEGIRTRALPQFDHISLFVEGDPALEATLSSAGAVATMRILRMSGDVPRVS